MYALRDVPGKGKGLVAAEKIRRGTRILSEEPVITVGAETAAIEWLLAVICRQFDALSRDQQQAFLSMHNTHAYSSVAELYLGIFQTNALPMTRGSGIFFEASRINHACDNNSQKSWNDNIKRHTVHALRDIDKGEEITIYYLGTDRSREARRQALQAKFGFACSCRLCSLPREQSEESDKRLDEIARLDRLISHRAMFEIVSNPLRMLRYIEHQVRLYNEQGPGDAGLPRAYLDAAQVVIANGDLARGRIFAERAVAGWTVLEGADGTSVLEHGGLSRDPSTLALYGMATKWKTTVDAVPQGLEPGDLEDWLWRRETLKRPEQLADLRSRTMFPAWTDLPDEHAADPDFYEGSGGLNYRPRRPWCFLAEMVDFFTLLRLQIEIKDRDGSAVPLFFYTDGQGRELEPAQLQKGHTVAILYAERHSFQFSEPGIRLEDPSMIKIFPASLQTLLALNDQVQQFSTALDGIRTCHGCGKKAASLKACGRCSFFWYCNKACQTAGWKEKGHKAECRLLRDPDMRGLFALARGEANALVRFPLGVANADAPSNANE